MLLLSSGAPDVPDGGPQRASVLPGQIRRRAAEVDTLAVWRSRGQHHRGAAQTGVRPALPARQLAALHMDLDLQHPVRRAETQAANTSVYFLLSQRPKPSVLVRLFLTSCLFSADSYWRHRSLKCLTNINQFYISDILPDVASLNERLIFVSSNPHIHSNHHHYCHIFYLQDLQSLPPALPVQ